MDLVSYHDRVLLLWAVMSSLLFSMVSQDWLPSTDCPSEPLCSPVILRQSNLLTQIETNVTVILYTVEMCEIFLIYNRMAWRDCALHCGS